MAVVTRDSNASLDASTGMFAPQTPDLIAGEDLDPVAPCYIAADGLVYMSDGSAADAEAGFDGFTARAVSSGQPVTLFGIGTRFRYAASGLTPGAKLYIAATPGALDTAATVGDAGGVAKAINETDIRVIRAA